MHGYSRGIRNFSMCVCVWWGGGISGLLSMYSHVNVAYKRVRLHDLSLRTSLLLYNVIDKGVVLGGGLPPPPSFLELCLFFQS